MSEEIQRVVDHLFEEHRLQLHVDYAYIAKYGEFHLLVPSVFREVIVEHFMNELDDITSTSTTRRK